VEYKKTLLGAASILALTAAASVPADAAASIQQDQQQNARSARVAEVPANLASDPLFDLLARTNGSVTAEAVEGAIQQMFANPTPDQLRNFPEFLRSIATLGASAGTLDRAKDALSKIVASAEMSDATRDSILGDLQAGMRPVQFAQTTRRNCNPRTGVWRNGRCEPLSTGNTGQPRDPATTGQVPGGPPGAPPGGGYQR
jgi:hypothetical protein